MALLYQKIANNLFILSLSHSSPGVPIADKFVSHKYVQGLGICKKILRVYRKKATYPFLVNGVVYPRTGGMIDSPFYVVARF